MVVSEGTRKKLDKLAVELRREFGEVPAARIERTLERVVNELVAQARFHDFVPLLAQREARERLRLASDSAELEPQRGLTDTEPAETKVA